MNNTARACQPLQSTESTEKAQAHQGPPLSVPNHGLMTASGTPDFSGLLPHHTTRRQNTFSQEVSDPPIADINDLIGRVGGPPPNTAICVVCLVDGRPALKVV